MPVNTCTINFSDIFSCLFRRHFRHVPAQPRARKYLVDQITDNWAFAYLTYA